MKDIFEKVKTLIKYDEIKLPETITFDSPIVDEAYENARDFKPFEQMSSSKWYYRSRKGKPVKLKDIGGAKIFEGVDVPLEEIHPHKLIKLLNLICNGRVHMPVVYKDSNNEYWNLSPDGLDIITILYFFKKESNIDVWLVDESIESNDFEEDDLMLGKEVFTPEYDYGNITDDDRILIREICEQLETKGNLSDSAFLRNQFQLKQIWQYDLANSPFVKMCKDNNIEIQKQGHMTTYENGEAREYPIVTLCEDIRKLEKLFASIVELKLSKN